MQWLHRTNATRPLITSSVDLVISGETYESANAAEAARYKQAQDVAHSTVQVIKGALAFMLAEAGILAFLLGALPVAEIAIALIVFLISTALAVLELVEVSWERANDSEHEANQKAINNLPRSKE